MQLMLFHSTEQVASYTTGIAQKRIRQLWGPACAYPCVQCGLKKSRTKIAWIYDGTDDSADRASKWPEFYMPLCWTCRNPRPQCEIEDCTRPKFSSNRCRLHDQHLRRAMAAPCKVRSCKNKAVAAFGYCAGHYSRFKKHGDAQEHIPLKKKADVLTYLGAHQRCYALWGRAREYHCIECDQLAREWAYDGTDPSEVFGPSSDRKSWVHYSIWPEFYVPMCAKCHRKKDIHVASAQLREYREWMRKTGKTLADVG